jgi:hypothetical protein
LQLPTVHVDALWHLRRAAGAPHRWLRGVVARAASAENQGLGAAAHTDP